MTAHTKDDMHWFETAHLFRGMRVNRDASWRNQTIGISVSHEGRGHTSRTWTMAMDDATSDVLVSSVIALLAKELETEMMVYTKLESAK